MSSRRSSSSLGNLASSKAVTPGLSVNLQQTRYDVVKESAMRHGYVDAGDAEDWDLCWSDLSVTVDKVAAMKPYQRLNHFPGMLDICRKVSLTKMMSRMAARLPNEYNFYPTSYMLPKQLDELLVALRKNSARIAQGESDVQTFILKPSSGAQGRGIHLVQTVAQLQGIDVTDAVAQRYVSKPLLVDGLKFDLRIYCLVLSVDPLKIFLYDEGLARMATTAYASPSSDNLDTSTIHLTNYAINKSSASFVSNGDGDGSEHGEGKKAATKRLASSVLSSIAQKRGIPYSKLVDDISSIVVKSVMAIQPNLAHTYHTSISAGTSRESTLQSSSCPCLAVDHHVPEGCSCSCPPSQCFEVLGFDIMFDDSLKPWLLEVNHSPSFSCDENIDPKIKSSLISDTLMALAQKTETREMFVDAQLQALSTRLYALSPSSSFKRPQSGFKQRSPSFAEQNLDDLLSTTPSFSGPSSSRPSSAVKRPTSASSSSWGRSSVLNQDPSAQSGSSRSLGGPGFLIGPHSSSSSDPQSSSKDPLFTCFSSSTSIGLWSQVFPSASDDTDLVMALRNRHLAILQAASDNFNDQRCSCSWCSKRMRRRYMSSGLSALARCDSSRSSEPSPYPSPRPNMHTHELRSLSVVERSPQGAESQPSRLPPRTPSPSMGGGRSRFESCLESRPSCSRMSTSFVQGAEGEREREGESSFGRSKLVKSASDTSAPLSSSSGSAFLALTEKRMALLKNKTSYLLSERSEPNIKAVPSTGSRKGGLGSAIRRRG